MATIRIAMLVPLVICCHSFACPSYAQVTQQGVSKAPHGVARSERPRIITMTDLGADPDDEQSMVRFLVMSNEFDVEGLIVSTGCWKRSQDDTSMLDEIVDAYGEVVASLQVHADTSRQVLHLTAAPGSSVTLSAQGSGDPDGDSLAYNWYVYREAGTYDGSVDILGSRSETASAPVPPDAGGATLHIILELRDTGSPNLYAYRRVVINVP